MPRCRHILIPMLALACLAGAQADAFKCRSPDGSIVISAAPCDGGSKTLAVQPQEQISAERRLQVERELERQRQQLAEREAARNEAEKREQETNKKLAEEESARRTRCIQNAEREMDPLIRADLIAACNGAAPQRPMVIQQPVYLPVPYPTKTHHQDWDCVGKNCKPFEPPTPPTPPKPSHEPDKKDKKACRQVTGVLSCN
ncbi:MAG TPA: hypothetical protein VFF03_17365 [Rhodocyclaceae bacterium]|nr:hypothetical protein [Rhodocyclaceae bacterium]